MEEQAAPTTPRSRESLAQIEDIIDGWGGGRPARHDELASRVDKLTRKVKDREVVVEQTVTEYVDVPVEFEETAAPQPAPVKSVKRKPRLLGFFGPKTTKKRVDAAVAERQAEHAAAPASASRRQETDAWDPSDRRVEPTPARLASKRPVRKSAKAAKPAKRAPSRKAAKKGGRKKR